MTRKSHTGYVKEWLTAQITAAKAAEQESIAEARLTMLSHLRIGERRRQRLMAIGKLTYNSCVDPATASKHMEMYLKNRKSIRPKEEWDRLSESLPDGRSNTNR